jgi:hypothetical protein
MDVTVYINTIMRDFRKEDSKYKIVAKLSIISVTTLLMMFAGIASIDSHYHSVYAASKNATSSSSSSTSKTKGGGSSSSNSTSPIGSSTFLNVITKVDNNKGGTAKPSDFTISVSGKSPSPKSFSGSSSGTSVTLNAGKYKVTASGPTGYTTKYSSGCSGTASGGAPIKCTISMSFSTPSPGGGNSTSTTTKTNGPVMRLIIVDKANCHINPCPALHVAYIILKDQYNSVIADFSSGTGPPPHYQTYPRNVNDFTGFAAGQKYNIAASANPKEYGPCLFGHCAFTYEEMRIISPAYSGKLCDSGSIGRPLATCSGIMPPDGVSIEFDVYHKCNNPNC